MPVLELDSLGTYWYEPEYCLRDALAQGLGAMHPLVQEVGRCGPNPNLYQQIKPMLEQYGVQHWISQQAWPQRSFALGAPVVWIIGRYSWHHHRTVTQGHAVFLRDPRILLADPDIIRAGYIMLTDHAPS